jgi:type II secretory pathway component PulF
MRSRLSPARRAALYTDIAMALDHTGNSVEALEELVLGSGTVNRGMRRALDAVREGRTLADGLAVAFPGTVPTWELAVLRVAEERSGQRQVETSRRVLRELAGRLSVQQNGAGQRRAALIYAAAVLLLVSVVAFAAARLFIPTLLPAVAQLHLAEPEDLVRARAAAEAMPRRLGLVAGALLVGGVLLQLLGYEGRHALLRRLSRRIAGAHAGVSVEAAALTSILRLTIAAGGDLPDALRFLDGAGVGIRGAIAAELFRNASAGSSVAELLRYHALLPGDLSARLIKAERHGLTPEALGAVEVELDRRRLEFRELLPQVTTVSATLAAGAVVLWFAAAVVVPMLSAFAATGL